MEEIGKGCTKRENPPALFFAFSAWLLEGLFGRDGKSMHGWNAIALMEGVFIGRCMLV